MEQVAFFVARVTKSIFSKSVDLSIKTRSAPGGFFHKSGGKPGDLFRNIKPDLVNNSFIQKTLVRYFYKNNDD